MDVKNRRVLVCGMARSGIAAAKLLCERGAHVTVNDLKKEEDFGGALDELRRLGCRFGLGDAPQAHFDGTDLLVMSPGIAWAKPFIQEALAAGIEVIGELELGARLTKGDLVAITGTNGKTTTTTLVGELFAAAGRTTYVVGNIGTPITTSAGISKEGDMTVAEVSSYQCESISRFHPHVGAVLNITEDHLARHGTMQVYVEMKRRIFARQTEQDVAVFNYDDAVCREMAEGLAARVIWFSRTQRVAQGACVEDGSIVFRFDGREAVVCRADEVRIPGPHNLENALAAVAIAGAAGVETGVMRSVLRSFAGQEINSVELLGYGALTGWRDIHQRLQGNQRRLYAESDCHDDAPDGAHPRRKRQEDVLCAAGQEHCCCADDRALRADRRYGGADPGSAGGGRIYELHDDRL